MDEYCHEFISTVFDKVVDQQLNWIEFLVKQMVIFK